MAGMSRCQPSPESFPAVTFSSPCRPINLVTERVNGLRNGILKIPIPALVSFIVLSTLVARLAVRRYEEQIEAINSYLEWCVKGHKKAPMNPLIGELHETRRH